MEKNTSRNISKIKYENRRERQNQYPEDTNAWPLTFLSWYRHFIKKMVGINEFYGPKHS
jgi:hypothetical protein